MRILFLYDGQSDLRAIDILSTDRGRDFLYMFNRPPHHAAESFNPQIIVAYGLAGWEEYDRLRNPPPEDIARDYPHRSGPTLFLDPDYEMDDFFIQPGCMIVQGEACSDKGKLLEAMNGMESIVRHRRKTFRAMMSTQAVIRAGEERLSRLRSDLTEEDRELSLSDIEDLLEDPE